MKERIPAPVLIVSASLILYILLLSFGAPLIVTRFLFIISPFLVIWMAVAILTSKTFTGKDLKEGEEWGYGDKQKEDPGMF